jgi:chromosome segregation ATPase
MTADREIQDEELMGVAQDPEQALRLHRSLRTIANATSLDPALREMARSVLSGHVDVRDAFQDPRYTEAVFERMHEIRRAAEDQTYAERQQSKAQFTAWDARQQAELDRERAERDAPTHGFGHGSGRGERPTQR